MNENVLPVSGAAEQPATSQPATAQPMTVPPMAAPPMTAPMTAPPAAGQPAGEQPVAELSPEGPLPFPEKLGLRGEYAGERIKDIADKVGFVGGVAALVIGFLIWSRANDISGFLVGLCVVGLGVFASYVIASVLYSYGDVVSNSFEQTSILKRLENQKLTDLLKRDQEEAQKKQAAESEAKVRASSKESEPDAVREVPEEQDKEPDKVALSTPESRRLELSRKLKMPLHGVIDARMRRVAHFTERCRHGIICPVCGRKQDSERNNCFFCDCRFVYDDDPFDNNGDNVLERLRHL